MIKFTIPARIKMSRHSIRLRAASLALILMLIVAASTSGQDAQSPDVPKHSTLKWDDLKPERPTQVHLFGAQHPAAMFKRPGELTLENWFHDGHMRVYALLHLNDVVRSAEIQRGKGAVYMFGNARVPDLLDNIVAKFPGRGFPKTDQPISLRELTSWINCQGIIVVRNGRIVFEEYPGMDPSQRHNWMSTSKSSLNILMGHLVSKGQLDLTKKVSDYVPALKDLGYGSFTVQELADMNADVNMDERNYHAPKSAFWDFGRSMNWFSDRGQWPGGNKQFLTTIERLEKPTGEAGETVRYTSSNSQVIAWVIEEITGESMPTCFERLIWQHIGAVSNATVTVDKHGFPFVGGGYSSTLRDLARYGMIWANSGIAPDGTRLFEKAWMQENTSGKGLRLWDHRYHNHSYNKGSAIVHQGHSGQMLWVNPTSGTIVATFGSMTTPGGGTSWSRQGYLFMAEAIDRHLTESDTAAALPNNRASKKGSIQNRQ